MRIGSLFSGAGGLDMAVEAVFGGRTVWHSEIDKAASKVLAHRWPDVPNLGSITEIDWATVEPVDVLCGGFPCQDVSAAGKRAGIKDGTRSGLWAVFADAIDALRPRYVIIENVRGLLSATAHRAVESDDAVVGDGSDRPVLRALGAVLGDLSDLGYDAVWATVAAASVGAPHRRERVFVVAYANVNTGGEQNSGELALLQERTQQGWGFKDSGRERTTCDGRPTPHPPRNGRDKGRPESARLVGESDAAVSGDEFGRVELLPTPCVVDRLATGEMTLEEWDESRRSQKERGVGSFGPRGDSLGAAILRVEEGTERPDYSTTKARRGGDEPGVALLPTPTTLDKVEKRTTHAGGNLTLQGAIVGVNPVDVERHSKAGRTVSGDDVALLPTPRSQDGNGYRQGPDADIANNGHTVSLADRVTRIPAGQLLPTPTAVQGRNETSGRQPGSKHNTGTTLNDVVFKGEIGNLLPTPQASDGTSGGASHPDRRVNAQGVKHGRSIRDYALLDNTPAWGKYTPAIHRWEQIVGPAPAPTEPNKNGNPRLSAAFSEWLMGWPAGWVTDPAIGISRNDQLRIVGNGVCPQQAIAALRYLLAVC